MVTRWRLKLLGGKVRVQPREETLKEVRKETSVSVQILRFADDIVVIAESKEDMTLYAWKNEYDTLKELTWK